MERSKGNWGIAIILNLLVMPGSGHILIGDRLKGYVICGITLLCLFIPIVSFMIKFYTVLTAPTTNIEEMIQGFSAMSTALAANKTLIIICAAGLTATWIYGVADLLIRKQKKG